MVTGIVVSGFVLCKANAFSGEPEGPSFKMVEDDFALLSLS